MNDRYGRNDRPDPRGRQGSQGANWQDRDRDDDDHPRQQQQWHDETRGYGDSMGRSRQGGQMGGQQGSYGGGSQDFWNRDDNDGSSTESQGRRDYGSQQSGWQGGGWQGSPGSGRHEHDRQQSPRSTGSYGQSGYGARGSDFSSFTGNDFGGRDFSSGHSAYGSSYSGGQGYGSSQGYGSRGGSASDGTYGGGVGGREYMRSGEDRGFIERAGDAIANWFSDDDDDSARRRQTNHRGRGPSGYTRSDERIKEDANDHLTHDPSVDASNITVSVENGEVTLNGTVSSRFAKRRAEDCVDHVSGVKHVQNNLRVQDRTTAGQSSMGQSSMGQTSTGQSSGGQQGTTTGAATTGATTAKSGSGATPR